MKMCLKYISHENVFEITKNNESSLLFSGARQAQGIVDAALQKAKSMVADRMAGRGGSRGKSGGGGGGSKQVWTAWHRDHFEGLAQDCSNSSALAMELLHSCLNVHFVYAPSQYWRDDAIL